MKNFKVLVFLLVSISSVFIMKAGLLYNTFQPGKTWHDTNGVHINAHGGGLLYHEGVYYWFGEHKSEKSYVALVGINCYSSRDLYNWTFESVALPVTNDKKSPVVSGSVMERPKVIFNEKTKQFVMYFHLELKDKGYEAARVGVAVSENVTGPYKLIKTERVNAGIWPLNMTVEQQKLKAAPKQFKTWWTPEWYEAVYNGMFVRQDFKGGQMSRDMTLFVDDDKKKPIISIHQKKTLHCTLRSLRMIIWIIRENTSGWNREDIIKLPPFLKRMENTL